MRPGEPRSPLIGVIIQCPWGWCTLRPVAQALFTQQIIEASCVHFLLGPTTQCGKKKPNRDPLKK